MCKEPLSGPLVRACQPAIVRWKPALLGSLRGAPKLASMSHSSMMTFFLGRVRGGNLDHSYASV